MDRLDDITVIKGIGDKSAPLYRKLGMNVVDDVINYFPRDYVYYDEENNAEDISSSGFVTIRATVAKRPLLKTVRRFKIVSAYLTAGDVVVSATWFNMPFLIKSLTVGNTYIFRGNLSPEGDHFHIEQPQVFTLEQYEKIRNSYIPVYPLTKGLTNNSICKSVKNALTGCNLQGEPIYTLHFPSSKEELVKARNIFVYEEFLLFILRLRMLKKSSERFENDFNIIPVSQTRRLIERLPYRLTGAQMRVFEEVESDLCSKHSMSRLIQGDVGSGKTIIAMLSCITACVNGYQSAMMAPTEILAMQHFESFCNTFRKYDIDLKVVLLTGSMTAKQKKEVYAQIDAGEADIIIGTHALIQEKVIYNNLALVITDEQHRFGVNQRNMLSVKSGKIPHVLVMSATPIPRTLAIILYGDLDISVIDEVPAQRKPIKNCVVDRNYRKKAYDFIRKEISQGHQAYVICPLVEESEALDVADATSYAKKLEAVFGDEVHVGCLTGKMKPSAKSKVMDDFANGNVDVLVSTTVVEVGVNVPNATVMLIEDADRFGLAQLHQLRGRIGRGDAQSYCIFMSGNNSAKNMDRLKILNESNDGFHIASEDLKLRGPGDFFGLRQSGDMHFKLADVFTDAVILQKAAEEADRLLESDPLLELAEHAELKEKLDRLLEQMQESYSI